MSKSGVIQSGEKEARLVPYRDTGGAVIERKGNLESTTIIRVARYVRCPETSLLRSVRHCIDCRHCAEFAQKGVRCANLSEYCYDWWKDERSVTATKILHPRKKSDFVNSTLQKIEKIVEKSKK